MVVRTAESIDLTSEIDQIYLYKNAPCFPSLMEPLSSTKILEVNVALLCFGIVEAGVLDELGCEAMDEELSFVLKESGNEMKRENKKIKFYLENIENLLRPLLYFCNKEALDMICFIYKATGKSHFELLFREFSEERDLLLELHLLMARITRSQPFDMSAIINTINSVKHENFKVNEQEEENISPEAVALLPGDYNDRVSKHSGGTSKRECSLLTPSEHLDRAKRLIFELKTQNKQFVLENMSTYLALRYDREVCCEFLKHSFDQHFVVCLNKFERVSGVFFYNVNICSLLLSRANSKSNNSFAFKHQIPLLAKTTWHANPFTIKRFLEFIFKTFRDPKVPLHDFTLLAKNIGVLADLQDVRLRFLFKDLLEYRVEKISELLGRGLLECIERVVGTFYKEREVEQSRLEEPLESNYWKIGAPLEDLEREIENSEEPFHRALKELSGGGDTDVALQIFKDPNLTEVYERRATDSIMESLSGERLRPIAESKCDVKSLQEEIDGFLIWASTKDELKECLLDKLCDLQEVAPEIRKTLCANLVDGIECTGWRHRKSVVEKLSLMESTCGEAFRNKLVEKLACDRAYIVRRLAQKARKKESIEHSVESQKIEASLGVAMK